jgi:dolichyl-phosphate-mannose--protein O-mannosyl transferase
MPSSLSAVTSSATLVPRMLTLFGASALTFMMLMYALERRHQLFVLAFALGCALSSAYGFLAGTWPFGVVEAIWALIALRRYSALAAGRPLVAAFRR